MSRVLKLGFSGAIQCLQQTEHSEIHGVILGTGKGSLVDTEEFLHSIKMYNETALNPTHFIHSTYNQLNGLISLNKKIDSYNVTYVHRAFSFEHSLTDAMMLIQNGEAENVLFGAFDEMTAEHYDIKNNWNYWKHEKIMNTELYNNISAGTIAGEGCSFYVLSTKPTQNNQCKVASVKTLYKPNENEIKQRIEEMLAENNLSHDDVDIIMHGNNGNENQLNHYDYFSEKFSQAAILHFKHLCGEFDTASQIGFWLSVKILEQQKITENLFNPLNKKYINKKNIRNILLYNNYFELNQSIFLLQI